MARPPKAGRNPERLGGGGATVVVTGVVGQLQRGSRVQPLSFARDIQPGLINVGHFRTGQTLFDAGVGLRQFRGTQVDGGLERSLRDRLPNTSATI